MSTKVSYKGAQIAEVGAQQTKTLLTAGKYCEDDLTLVNEDLDSDVFETILDASYVGDVTTASELSGRESDLRTFMYSCVPSTGLFFFVYKGSWLDVYGSDKQRLFIAAVNNGTGRSGALRGYGLGSNTGFSSVGNWFDGRTNIYMQAGSVYSIYRWNSGG